MDQAKAKRAPGRPRIVPEGGKRILVYLDLASIARARALGGGTLRSVSAGIRKALAAAI